MTRRYRRVVATRFVNEPGSLMMTEAGCEKCLRGTPGAELAFASGAPLTVIDKTGYGLTGATEAPMRAALESAGIEPGDEIDLCGVDTDACVLKVALDLFDLGYRPRIVLDACASGNGADYHDRALDIFTRQLGPNAVIRAPADVAG